MEVKNIDAETAKEWVKKNRNGILIVDVRTPQEHFSGRIPGSKLIPLDELPRRINELNRDTPVLLYCRSGARSLVASRFLLQNGFKHVYNLKGGIISCPDECIE